MIRFKFTHLLIFICITYIFIPFNSEASEEKVPTFKDVKDKVKIYSPGTLGQTAVWGDYNNDGWQDLLISGFNMHRHYIRAKNLPKNKSVDKKGVKTDRRLLLFTNKKGTSFQERSSKMGLPDITAIAASWADFNNDGYIDLAIVTIEGGQPPKLFKNIKGTSFVDVSDKAGITEGGTSASQVIWVDYDKDGFVDLFVVGSNGSRLYRNKGDGSFEDVTVKAGLDKSFGSNGAVWFDSNNDGYPDLFLANSGFNSFYLNNGDGTLKDVTEKSGLFGEDSWKTTSACAGDYNGDGYIDLYVTNMGGKARRNALYRNNKDGTFTDVTAETLTGTNAADGRTCAWVDFDADGNLDLFTTNHVRPNKLFRNTGKGTFKDVASKAGIDLPLDIFAATWGDYDRDGFIDVFLNGHIGSALMKNGGNTNNSLTLSLKGDGKKSNSSAIGARVEVSSHNRVQIREVSGGRGCCEQDMLPVYFGLGGDKSADIKVIWPSGDVCSFKGVSVVTSKEYTINEKKCEISPLKK